MHIHTFTGEAIKPYIRTLAELRIEVFREYPYLYEGDFDYEQVYLFSFIHAQNSSITIVFDGGYNVVGASTCIALAEADDFAKTPFIEKGMNLSKGVYFGESVLKKEFRGRGIGRQIFAAREKKAIQDFKKHNIKGECFATFCAIDRPSNYHTPPPADYWKLDSFWMRNGYHKEAHLKAQISWKEIGQKEEQMHQLPFWRKKFLIK